jgi:hypothetical protein
MKLEALSEILDTVSFILVTPEFLRESRLCRIRLQLEKLVAFIMSRLNMPYSKTTQTRDLRYVILVGIVAAGIPFAIVGAVDYIAPKFDYIVWHPAIFLSLFGINFIIFGILGLFVIGIEKVAVRGILFLIGTSLFFVTRALMFWFSF